MSIINKLIGTEYPKLAVHQFCATIDYYSKGLLTRLEIKNGLDITEAEDIQEFNWLLDKVDVCSDKPAMVQDLTQMFLFTDARLYGYDNKQQIIDRINALAV